MPHPPPLPPFDDPPISGGAPPSHPSPTIVPNQADGHCSLPSHHRVRPPLHPPFPPHIATGTPPPAPLLHRAPGPLFHLHPCVHSTINSQETTNYTPPPMGLQGHHQSPVPSHPFPMSQRAPSLPAAPSSHATSESDKVTHRRSSSHSSGSSFSCPTSPRMLTTTGIPFVTIPTSALPPLEPPHPWPSSSLQPFL